MRVMAKKVGRVAMIAFGILLTIWFFIHPPPI